MFKRSLLLLLLVSQAAFGQSAQPMFDRLSKLRDVQLVNLLDGQVLTYDLASGKWKNAAGGSGGGISLSGENYLSLAGSVLTANAVNLGGSNATGTLAAGREPAHTGDVTNSAGSLTLTLANIPDLVPQAGSILATNIAAPSSPAVGKTKLYADSTSKNFASKNDNGTVNHGMQTMAGPANQFAIATHDNGTIDFAQPAFAGISGTLDLGGAQASGTLAAGREPAHTGDVTNSAGSLALTLVNIPDLTTQAASILATNIAAPTSPAAGKNKLYFDSTSKNIAAKNDAGTVNHGIQTRTATADNWIRSIADDGTTAISQPAFTNISGTATDAQVPDILTVSKISNLTTNGLVTTGSGDGTLSVTHFADGFLFAGIGSYIFSQNANTQFDVKNGSATANATAQISVEADSGVADFTIFPVNYVTSGINVAGSAKLASPAQLTIASASGKPILFSGDGEATEGAAFWFGQTVASGAAAVLDEVKIDAKTSTLTGTTTVATAKGFNKFSIYLPTYTDSLSATVTRAATLYVEGAPAAAGSVTITNPYALWIDGGIARFDGGLKFTEAAPASGLFAQSTGTVYSDSAYALPAAVGSAGNEFVSNGTSVTSTAPASFQGSSASPTGTASTTGVMMGVSGTITPTFSGRIMVSVTGNLKNGTIADGASMHIRTGTGTKPVNGAALTGTAVGGAPQLQNTPSATFICPISDTAIVTGLAVGTAVWLDVDLAAITGGTAALQSVAISAFEF